MLSQRAKMTIGSGLILIAGVFLAVKTAIYPFVALFAFDAPDAADHPWAWIVFPVLALSPLLAAAVVLEMLSNLRSPAPKAMLRAGALLLVPLAAFLTMHHSR